MKFRGLPLEEREKIIETSVPVSGTNQRGTNGWGIDLALLDLIEKQVKEL